MKSLVTLLTTLINELGEECALDTSRDEETLARRFLQEGLPFLTTTLPALGTGLETGLARGFVTPTDFPGFRVVGNLPVFLGGFYDLVFNRESGSLLDDPSISSIRNLRQITLVGKKIEAESSEENIQRAYDAYVSCDLEVEDWESRAEISQLIRFYELAQLIFSSAFRSVDLAIRDWKVRPRHGSGSVADGLKGNQKFTFPRWSDRLESVMPYWRYATTRGYDQSRYSSVDFQEPGGESPVKVIHVPKTIDKPRIIAMEPSYKMWAQQGIFALISDAVESSFLDDLIGTSSQLPNQQLAEEGSREGTLATLDLSEASDRVSNLLVETLTSGFPHFQDAVRATRSSQAIVPGHGVIPLSKFASMGSALCFPMESMVFLTVVLLGIEDAQGTPFRSLSQIKRLIGRVRVYGDDIVVPVEYAEPVMASLEAFGLKVNAHKSFWTGQFRESCGKEYFAGADVSLARLRRRLPSSLHDVSEVVSLTSFRNQLYWRGLWKTAGWVDQELTELLGYFPVVSETSVVLGRASVLGLPEYKLDRNLHSPVVKGLVAKLTKTSSNIDGEPALMKTLCDEWDVELDNSRLRDAAPRGWCTPLVKADDHLRYAGRPKAVALHLRTRLA